MGREGNPHLLIDTWVTASVAVNWSTLAINSWMRLPDFAMTSSRLHATPDSTGGTFSSISGGNQLEGNRAAVASIGCGGGGHARPGGKSLAAPPGVLPFCCCFEGGAA